MATNLALDPKLLDQVLELSGEPTKKAAVTLALKEFVARREQKKFAELFGKLLGSELRRQGRAQQAMTLLTDTSVWSLALRCDGPAELPEVQALHAALAKSATPAAGPAFRSGPSMRCSSNSAAGTI